MACRTFYRFEVSPVFLPFIRKRSCILIHIQTYCNEMLDPNALPVKVVLKLRLGLYLTGLQ